GGVEFFAVSGDGKHVLAEHRATREEKYDPKIHQGIRPRGDLISIVEVSWRLWDVGTGKELGLLAGPYGSSWRQKYTGMAGRFSPWGGAHRSGVPAPPPPPPVNRSLPRPPACSRSWCESKAGSSPPPSWTSRPGRRYASSRGCANTRSRRSSFPPTAAAWPS